MKICIKKTNDRDENDYISIAKIYFNESSISKNNLFLETIDYPDILQVPANSDYGYFFDLSLLKEFNQKNFVNVISYNEGLIIISSEKSNSFQTLYTIDFDWFCRGLEFILSDRDFSVLEENLIKNEKERLDVVRHTNNYPLITDYIRKHPNSFKTVYYAGAGYDLSPLQLFSKNANVEKIYFSDYFFDRDDSEKIKGRIDERCENVIELKPRDFNKRSWADFWHPGTIANEMFYHPDTAWGRLIRINQSLQLNKYFDFYYLGTEGVQTAEILIENKIIPDVLVIQDHGFGGNWAEFGGVDSPLYKVMKNNLPEYILSNPDNEMLWPGYKQVTETYNPGLPDANPMQLMNQRELYKRKI